MPPEPRSAQKLAPTPRASWTKRSKKSWLNVLNHRPSSPNSSDPPRSQYPFGRRSWIHAEGVCWECRTKPPSLERPPKLDFGWGITANSPAMPKILVIHGPNLNLLGERETQLYGTDTLAAIDGRLRERGKALKVDVATFQNN